MVGADVWGKRVVAAIELGGVVVGLRFDDGTAVEFSRARVVERPAAQLHNTMCAAAIDVLSREMAADPDYAWGWHCVIACAAQDEGCHHAAANRAANRAMQIMFKVDTKEPTRREDDAVTR